MGALETMKFATLALGENKRLRRRPGLCGPGTPTGRPSLWMDDKRTDDDGVEPNWKLILSFFTGPCCKD